MKYEIMHKIILNNCVWYQFICYPSVFTLLSIFLRVLSRFFSVFLRKCSVILNVFIELEIEFVDTVGIMEERKMYVQSYHTLLKLVYDTGLFSRRGRFFVKANIIKFRSLPKKVPNFLNHPPPKKIDPYPLLFSVVCTFILLHTPRLVLDLQEVINYSQVVSNLTDLFFIWLIPH